MIYLQWYSYVHLTPGTPSLLLGAVYKKPANTQKRVNDESYGQYFVSSLHFPLHLWLGLRILFLHLCKYHL